MSKPFEFKDFSKRYSDLSSNNFPLLNSKTNLLQDSLKFKFSSKAQKGVKLDSSVTNINSNETDSEFGVKLNFEDFEGLELGYKLKSKPSSEITLRFDDKRIPLEGSALTLKLAGVAPGEQTVGGTFNFANRFVNLNLGVSVPLAYKIFSYLNEDSIKDQRVKVDFDFVSRPVEDRDFFVGAEVKTQLPKEKKELLYTSKISFGLNNDTTNGGVFVDHKKEQQKDESYQHTTSYGAWLYTEVDDLSGGSKVGYTPSKSSEPGKGLEFELVAGLKRDQDSKLSSKVTVVPHTTVSLGYEQKLSHATKLTFGYAFLLNKSHENSSAYSFGIEISH